jgi:hypothetical protein
MRNLPHHLFFVEKRGLGYLVPGLVVSIILLVLALGSSTRITKIPQEIFPGEFFFISG